MRTCTLMSMWGCNYTYIHRIFAFKIQMHTNFGWREMYRSFFSFLYPQSFAAVNPLRVVKSLLFNALCRLCTNMFLHMQKAIFLPFRYVLYARYRKYLPSFKYCLMNGILLRNTFISFNKNSPPNILLTLNTFTKKSTWIYFFGFEKLSQIKWFVGFCVWQFSHKVIN